MINEVFSRLNDWRKLPAYQLERRADIFFAVYLEKIFKEYFSEDVIDVIPEFPVRIGTIYSDRDTNETIKTDYCVFTKSGKVYLVELKTDDASISPEQIKNYVESIKKGFEEITKGIFQLCKHTESRAKYENLLSKLINLGAVKQIGYKPEATKYLKWINNLESTNKYCFYGKPVFIKPTKKEGDSCKIEIIDFDRIINIIAKENDDVSKQFVESLKKWKNPV